MLVYSFSTYFHIVLRLFIYVVVFFYSFIENSAPLLLIFMLISSVSIIFKVRKCLPILLMFLFFITYVINLIPFFFYGHYIFAYTPSNFFYETLQIHALFLFCVDVVLLPVGKRLYINELVVQKENKLAFYFLVFLFLFFLIFALRGDTIIDTGGYGKGGDKTSLGGFGEYFLTLVPLMYIFAGNNYIYKKITSILLLLMCAKLLLYGGRVGVLMIGLQCFIFYYDTKKRNISPVKLLLFSLPVLYIFVLLGSIRGNILIALESSLGDILLMPFKTDFLRTYIDFFGNQNDIFYSSTILNQAAFTGVIDVSTRFEMFFYNMLSLFVPYSLLPEKAMVIPYIQKNISNTGGGGLISSYFYFFISYPGVILGGVILAYFINKINKTKNIIFILYMIMVLSTYPRWFGYNMIGLFKLSFYIVPVYLFTKLLFDKIKIK